MADRPIHVRLRPDAENRVRAGHPWIYDQSIREQRGPGRAGDLAVVFDRNNKFLAIGFYDPESPIRIRVLHRGKPVEITSDFWRERIKQSSADRRGLFDEQTSGYRLVNGENDFLPALVLDRYSETLVLKLYSAVWFPRLPEMEGIIKEEYKPEHLVLRLSRNIQDAAKGFGFHDSQILGGSPLQNAVIFLENGMRFEADVLRGQKTGFFLDQRENRAEGGRFSKGRKVLNAFSFSGGFSLYAARGGAKSVTDLDISAHALESAKRNFRLNQHDKNIAACKHELVQADAFEWLARSSEKFDLIVLDPPSLAKREHERQGAIEAYGALASGAISLLNPGGILLAASCSAHVTAEEFFDRIETVARRTGRKFTVLKKTAEAPDHPAIFPEAHYLKCIYLEFRSLK